LIQNRDLRNELPMISALRLINSAAAIVGVALAVANCRAADLTGEFIGSVPDQLQYSCGVSVNGDEEELASTMADSEKSAAERALAAHRLWNGHSRRHAIEVLKFSVDAPLGGDEFRQLQREIDMSFDPAMMKLELEKRDPVWAAWLAFLRPNEKCVPLLVDAVENSKQSDYRIAATLALGNSGDARALKPLLALATGGGDSQLAGFAAAALGYLGDASAEPELIKLLAASDAWRQVKAAGALSKIGTDKSLPALDALLNDKRYTGALAVRGTAEAARASIQHRQRVAIEQRRHAKESGESASR
jgi:HEAT repeat protein